MSLPMAPFPLPVLFTFVFILDAPDPLFSTLLSSNSLKIAWPVRFTGQLPGEAGGVHLLCRGTGGCIKGGKAIAPFGRFRRRGRIYWKEIVLVQGRTEGRLRSRPWGIQGRSISILRIMMQIKFLIKEHSIPHLKVNNQILHRRKYSSSPNFNRRRLLESFVSKNILTRKRFLRLRSI